MLGTATETAAVPHPLVYVAIEVRVPFAPRLQGSDLGDHLQRSLPGKLLLRQETRGRVDAATNGVTVLQEQGWRLIDRESTMSFVVTPTSLTYETTRYPGFEPALDLFTDFLRVVDYFAAPVGVERVGVRYVNEVWPPREVSSFRDWAEWIQPDLIGAASSAEQVGHDGVPAVGGATLSGMEQVLKFDILDDRALILRLAAFSGSGVVGNEPLRRWTNPGPGQFFVVDMDSYWPRGAGSTVQDFEVGQVRDTVRELHDPLKELFHWSVRDTFRSLTIRRPQPEA